MLLKVKFKHYVVMSPTVLQLVNSRRCFSENGKEMYCNEKQKVTVCLFIYSFILAQRDTEKDWNM